MKTALKRQYHTGLAMLRQCIERCPDDLWLSGEAPRNFWRVAYHTIYYTHLYLLKDKASFVPWKKHRKNLNALWLRPTKEIAYTKDEVSSYLALLEASVDEYVDALDLDAKQSGFSLYKMPKVEHQLVNLRHMQNHIGQLGELLMARGIYVEWQ